jgi:membrane protease YdiL (CAAX protease family)
VSEADARAAPGFAPTPGRPTFSAWVQVVRGAAYAVLLAWAVGEASMTLSTLLAESGGPPLMREPIALALALGAFATWRRFSPGAAHGRPYQGDFGHGLLLGSALGLAVAAAALVLADATGWAQARWGAGTAPFASALVALPLILVHGFWEELMLRGVAQRTAERALGAAWGPWGGIATGALAFALLQALQGYDGPVHIANSLLFGALAGHLARGKGGIVAAGALHGTWSWFDLSLAPVLADVAFVDGVQGGGGRDAYGSLALTLVAAVTLALLVWRARVSAAKAPAKPG